MAPAPIQYVKNDQQPPHFETEEAEKSVQHDHFDQKQLINSVQPIFQSKAEQLLKALDENPLEVTFNSKGELFIDSNSIPNANIYKIFPELFVRKTKKPIPGMPELVTKIALLGYGHLINRGIVKGLKRTIHSQHNYQDLNHQIKKMKNWWFIGE